jgi:cytochrome P450
VSFGWGIHRCVGAFMAQTELRLLTRALLAAGTIRVAGEPKPAALEGGAHMGLAKLPLTLASN